ncbi:peptide deformylase [Blattabacterium cuenoti]|uniref:peptide deformylase n=1 Tax=Blattabacterium cuenoti TaxID=1653831 RepID=UPI00163CB661|nr:peptide deformylase [Blattabacterium cuenoti]
MILPIILYGNPILRKKCLNIDFISSRKVTDKLIKDMYETVHKVNGIGLAAPQIGKNISLFIINIPFFNGKKIIYFQEVFINAFILKIYGKEYKFNEGCLSIPGIMSYIKRKSNVLIEYYDKNYNKQKKKLSGMCARIILHEYDHLNGKLFIDYLSYKKRKLIEKKLIFIQKNHIKT